MAVPLFIIGAASLFIGFAYYLRAKGYNPIWSFLIFLFGPIAFVILFLLPDRKQAALEPSL
jgi:hypothetical protein